MKKILHRAATIIQKNGHCKGQYALDKNGNCTDVLGEDAVCFCAVGALRKAAAEVVEDPFSLAHDISNEVGNLLGINPNVDSIISWNDKPERTKAEVVKVLREAARLCP